MPRAKLKETEDSSWEELLIDAVYLRPCIYDLKDPDYSRKKRKAAAWKEIAEEVLKNENVCRTRWRSLRDMFKRKDCKVKKGKSGDGTEDGDIEITSWPWFSRLSFLRETTHTGETQDSLEQNDPIVDENQSEPSNENHQHGDCSISSAATFADNSESAPNTPKSQTQNRKRKSSPSKWVQLLDQVKTTFASTGPKEECETVNESFASYISKEMEDLNSEECSEFKFQVATLLHGIKKARHSTIVVNLTTE